MSNLDTAISIVPRLPPSIDGVGDYALNLARQLRNDFNIQTQFVVGDPSWNGAVEIEGFPVKKIQDRSPEALLDALSENLSAPVLLHSVGYGYDRRGCPRWLVKGLQHWRNLYPNLSLVTMFHEISAFGPPWTSAFWLSSLQKNLVGKLATISNNCITSKQSYADLVNRLSKYLKIEIYCLPVFSTIGEPGFLRPLNERSRRLIVFGSRNARLQIYDRCIPSITKICKLLDIQEIVDIGVPTNLRFKEISVIPVREEGILEASKISELMQDAIAGFLDFPPPSYLAKSTVFASYCAHGLIPCMVNYSTAPIDGLEIEKHYWSSKNNIQLSLDEGQNIANSAHKWYYSHSLSAHSKIFHHKLFQS